MIINYGTYIARVEFDQDMEMFSGQVINLSTPLTFMAGDAAELKREFRNSIDAYLDVCKENGIAPEKTYSGKFVLRTGVELHQRVATAAARDNKSLNSWLIEAIEKAIG